MPGTIRSRNSPTCRAAVSERSAVRALFGEIPTRGRLPVTIPGIAARGADRTVDRAVIRGERARQYQRQQSSKG